MESFRMVFTLFLFCFVAAFLLAFVDKKTYPIISKQKAMEEAKAKKEVLLMKNGGISLDSFPEGTYKVEDKNNKAEFIIKGGEITFKTLIISGKDYLKSVADEKGSKETKSSPSPVEVLIKSFNEKRVIDGGNIVGTKEAITVAQNFLKENPRFITSLIDILLSPVRYKKISVIEFNINGKLQPIAIRDDKYIFLAGKKISYLRDGNIVKITKIDEEKAYPGKEYSLGNIKVKINSANEYQVMDYYNAYYGEKYIGTVFKIAPNCFADKVVTMVGVKPDGKVAGIKVLSQAETPGLGARVLEVRKGEKEPWWQAEFHNLNPEDLYLKEKDEKKGKIDVFTAATITPRRLTAGIRKAVNKYISIKNILLEEAK